MLPSQVSCQVLQGQKLRQRNPKQIGNSVEMAGFHPAATRNFTALLRVGLLAADSVLGLTDRHWRCSTNVRAESRQMLWDCVAC